MIVGDGMVFLGFRKSRFYGFAWILGGPGYIYWSIIEIPFRVSSLRRPAQRHLSCPGLEDMPEISFRALKFPISYLESHRSRKTSVYEVEYQHVRRYGSWYMLYYPAFGYREHKLV